MSAPQSDLDRNLPATPYKLEKAKEKGQVAKATDLVGALVFTVAVLYLTWRGWPTVRELFRFDQAMLIQAGRTPLNAAVAWNLIHRVMMALLVLLGPFFGALMLAGVLGNVLQTGMVFSFTPLKPDWNRINPATGMKRVFSMNTLFAAARASLKLILLGLVAYYALKRMVPSFFHLAGFSPRGQLNALIEDLSSLGFKVALTLGLLAILDLMYTRWSFAKQMRMSHREVKDELKHREGDPRIRSRMKALRRELMKRVQALQRTRQADLLITNPTHVAVALRYEHGQMASPQLLCKGKGFMAAAMRRIAARHHIPVVQNPSLARQLYREMALDQHVPPDLYAPVARIVIWVLAQREARGETTRRTPEPTQKQGMRQAWNS